MMLEWLDHPECVKAAEQIREAVHTVFADPKSRTRDMGGTLSTSAMTEAVCSAIHNLAGLGR
jgi:3-isopropylmalate dehydrogenase